MDIGTLQANLKLNSDEFKNKLNQAKSSIANFASNLKSGLNSELKQSESAYNELGEAINDAVDDTKKLKQATDDASDALETNRKKSDEASAGIEKTGNKAKDSSSAIGTLKSALGMIGITVGMSQLIQVLKDIGEQALKAADDVDDSIRQIAVAIGVNSQASSEIMAIADDLAKTMGYSQNEIALTAAELKSFNKSLSTEELTNLTREYQSFIGLTGNTTTVFQLTEMFKKWGIATDEQAGYLKYLFNVSKETPIEDMISILAEGDRSFQLLNMDLKESAAYIESLTDAGALSDAKSLGSGIETLLAMEAKKSTYDANRIDTIVKNIQAYKQEADAIKYLSTELGISTLEARILISTYKNTSDATKGIEELTQSLIDLTTVSVASSDEEAKKYINTIIEEIKAIGDEQAAVAYLERTYGMKAGFATTLAGAVYSNAQNAEILKETADSVSGSLSEIDQTLLSSSQKGTILAENWNDTIEPVGDNLQIIRDNLIAILQQEDKLKTMWDLLVGVRWLSPIPISEIPLSFDTGNGVIKGMNDIGKLSDEDYDLIKSGNANNITITNNYHVPTVSEYDIMRTQQDNAQQLANNPYYTG